MSAKLSYATFVFDTLTNTKSVTAPTASKAGLYLELQYDTASSPNPNLIGGKIIDHRLERSRITSVPTGERSFHVLYYLLAGTSTPEKYHLGFDSPVNIHTGNNKLSVSPDGRRWRYLGHPTQLKVGVNDAEGFQHFKTALRRLGFLRNDIAEICQVLASILHIGQLVFGTEQATTTGADESGGYSHEGGETVTVVKNKDALAIVAAFLGLGVEQLETSLGYRTKTIGRERVTVMLDPTGARQNADELARTIYSLLVTYVTESVNQRICAVEDSVSNTVSIVDFPGFAQASSTGSTLDQLLTNAANESLYNFCLQTFFDRRADMLEREEVTVPATSYYDNTDAARGLLKHGNGLLSILDDQMRRGRSDDQFLDSIKKRFEKKSSAITVGTFGSSGSYLMQKRAFTVKHYAGEVDYPVNGLIEENGEVIPADLMNLMKSTKSDFVKDLFGQEALQSAAHPRDTAAVMQTQISSKPLRMPSIARRKSGQPPEYPGFKTSTGSESPEEYGSHNGSTKESAKKAKSRSALVVGAGHGAAGEFLSSLDIVNRCLTSSNLNPYFVLCLKPNDRRIANQFDSQCVRSQVQTLGIAEISQRLRNANFSVFLPFEEFLGLAEVSNTFVGSDKEKAEFVLDEKRWPGNEARVGSTGVFLSERCWADLARVSENFFIPVYPPMGIDDGGDGVLHPRNEAYNESNDRLVNSTDQSPEAYISGDEIKHDYFGSRELDARSDGCASTGDMFRNFETREQMLEKGNDKKMEELDELPVSSARKIWLQIVWCLTFLVPTIFIKKFGRLKRKDVQLAWREKLAINLLIWFGCLFAIFIVVGFPEALCPRQHVFSENELGQYNGQGQKSYTAIRGIVFDLGAFMPNHYPNIVSDKEMKGYAGKDATNLFPIQVSALCQGKHGSIDPSVPLDFKSVNDSAPGNDPNARYHDFRSFRNDTREDWYHQQITYLKRNYKKGYMGIKPNTVDKYASSKQYVGNIHGSLYNLTDYIAGGRVPHVRPGKELPSNVDVDYMDESVVQLFLQHSGNDMGKYWDKLQIDDNMRQRMKTCLDNLFFIGHLDTRESFRCQFARYFILGISVFVVVVIGFKFLAALQFGRKNLPEDLDKFIICQVPVYTEDEDSLRRAIESLARMRYDDKRKLLVVVCDGMIIGQGNDRPTPRIVLDILGVPDTVDPEPLSFESVGEGMRQHNMGKVYSGLYEVQGHIVPFLVVVKVGKPSEVSRPGNRGKRDSQLVVMRFLNRVHYNLPMNPMELEMFHEIRNVIGVNPGFYEYIFQVDADTVVAPDAATRFVGQMLSDVRVIGVCGETSLENAKKSIITMIQVYEYYISHNLIKAFESLFGSVTCLPGCFTMYRIRTSETAKPLFVSKEVVDSYSEIRVDTLHMKNLLHLGEDRYLTTLLLKYHGKFKTKFIFNAHAFTIAPESFAIFLSQRRRWINSTVHNLVELIPLDQLCGFCCFSMRFVVFMDLLSTVIQPVTLAYIIYLIVWLIIDTGIIPWTAFVILAAVYGLQAIIFLLRRKWDMVGWMFIYILALPIHTLALPLYSFWHMDDFSWGNTRVITGEKGKKLVLSDEGKFDPNSIPKRKWEDYQAEVWENHLQQDDQSEISGFSYGTKSYNPAHSDYGYPYSRPASQLDLPRYTSRASLSPSEMVSSGNNMDMEMMDFSNLPSDDAILAEIRDVLKTADLMTVTKKSVKQELEVRFGTNLDAKKPYINSGEFVLFGMYVLQRNEADYLGLVATEAVLAGLL